MRTADEATRNPERNAAYLLACLLMNAVVICLPKSKRASFIKPATAMSYPLAIIRTFKRWHVTMPCYKLLHAQLNGLKDEYVRVYGPLSLAPHHAESTKFSMVREILSILNGVRVGCLSLRYSDHNVTMFR